MDARQKIVIINRYSWNEGCPTGKLASELTLDLTTPERKAYFVCAPTGYLARRERTLLSRMYVDLSWMLDTLWLIGTMKHAHEKLIVVTSDPPLFYLFIILIGKVRGFRTVVWVHDIYPEIATRLGVIPRWIGEPLRWIRNIILKRAWKVVVVGRCMQSYLNTQGIDSTVITNWVDSQHIPVQPFPHKFVMGYPGRIGRIHGIEQLGEKFSIQQVQAETDTLFYHRLGAYSLHIVTLDVRLAGLAVPSKVYAAMATGRAVIFFGPQNCEITDFINEHETGYAVTSRESFISYVNLFMRQWDLFIWLGRNARKAVEQYADRKVCTAQWRKLLY